MSEEGSSNTEVSEHSPLLSSSPQNSLNYNELPTFSTVEYRVYTRRWFILSVLCFLNIANAMVWISFASVADKTGKFFNVSNDFVNWLSLVFLVAAIPCGLSATWVIDSLGLRASIILGAWLNFIGAFLRMLCAFSFVDSTAKLPLVMIGQTIAACAQPFAFFAPTKLAALWFRGNQRVTANTLASMSNPLGILLANVISPSIVKNSEDVGTMLIAYCVPAGAVMLLATFGVCKSSPPTPPTASAAEDSESFLKGVKKVVKNKTYWVLAVCFGVGVGAFTAVTTLLEQMLCARGYDDGFAGLCGALLIGVGIVGAGIAGVIVDYTKMFDIVIKICFCLAGIGAIFFSLVSRLREQNALIAISVSMFGFFGFAVYPLCLEVGVEITYPVAEGTSAGLLLTISQAISIGVILLMMNTVQALSPYDQQYEKCGDVRQPGHAAQDYTVPNLLLCGIVVLSAIVLAIFFRPRYHRLEAEQQITAASILNVDASRPSTPAPRQA